TIPGRETVLPDDLDKRLAEGASRLPGHTEGICRRHPVHSHAPGKASATNVRRGEDRGLPRWRFVYLRPATENKTIRAEQRGCLFKGGVVAVDKEFRDP